MEIDGNFDAILQQLHESAQRLPKEIVVVNDPLRPEYSMLAHPDGRVQFKPSLGLVRYKVVADVIQQFISCGFTIKKVVDLGCSDKSFLMHGLLKMPSIREVVCLDQHLSKLVEEKLLFQADVDRRAQSLRVHLIEANILDVPRPICRPQVVTLIEVIEHFQVADLPRLLWIVFCLMQPRVIIITTPNSDFNLTYPVPGGKRFRHYDHKFEWNKIEFEKFCEAVTEIYPNYSVVFDGCGYGASGHYCTQIAVFCVASFRASLKGKPVGARKDSIVEKILNLNETLSKTSDSKKVNSTHPGPGCEACPVPFHCDGEQGRELNENERNVNLVLSELHSLAKQQMRSTEPEAKGDSMISETETVPPKREHEDTSSTVETEGDGRKVDAKLLDASLLKLSLKDPSDPSADLPTPESPSTTTPVHGDIPQVVFNRYEHFTDKYHTVQDIIYEDVETLLTNALLQETGRFVWCCNSNNIYYPFTDKIEKFKGAWNFLEILKSKKGNKPVKKRLISPFTEMSNVSYKASKHMPRYTDEKDGACCEEHRSYKIFCHKCPFLYIKKKVLPKTENHPKMHTKHWYQNYVVYENSSATKLWFSLPLLKNYLGINDEKVVRKALSLTDNYTPVEIRDKKRTFEYYSCVIGEEEEKTEDDLDDDDDGSDDDDDGGDSFPPSAGFSGSQDSLPPGRDESSRSTPPPSPALFSQGGGNHARGESVDSLDPMETRRASPQEENGESPAQPMDHRVSDFRLSRAPEEAGSCVLGTVPHRPCTLGSTEWAIARAIAEAFGSTHNMNKSLLTDAILCGLTTMADMRAACANAEPADRYHSFDFHGQGERGSTLSALQTYERGTHESSTAVHDASCDSDALPPTGVASSGTHLPAVKHFSLVEVSRTSQQAPSTATMRAASCVNDRIRSSVTASSSVRRPLVAASTAPAIPASGGARVTSSARSGLKLLAKSQPNVSLLGGVRAQSTAARTLPKDTVTTCTAGRTTSSVTRTTSAPRTTHSATRPLVAGAARLAANATRITPCPADSVVARGIKTAPHRLSLASSSRGAVLRDARVPAAAPGRSASKASLSSQKITADKSSA